ncbi:hypothetical protein [Fulvimonas yonginensis]
MPEDEYRKLIHVNEDIQPLGEHPFGENISLYDGSLSFTQTDISLPGNGPLLQLVRQFNADGNRPVIPHAEGVFADWELLVPHLESFTAGTPPTATDPGVSMWYYNEVTGHVQAVNGWQIDPLAQGIDPYADVNTRCSNFTAPPTVIRHLGDPALVEWDPSEWWKGYHLVLPGEGSQDLLASVDAGTKSTYPVVTKSHWRFSCLPSTANGQPGEGFLGESPDGTKYWFNELVYRPAPEMARHLYDGTASVRRSSDTQMARLDEVIETLITVLTGSNTAHAATTTDVMVRSLGVLLVTKVQDRFGNTLNYSYDADGYLTAITASDGRALSLTYVAGTHRVQSVTLQPASGSPRTWTYAYSSDNTTLTAVVLPDSSQWRFDFALLDRASLSGDAGSSSCLRPTVPGVLSPVSGTIIHPSGLTGTFTVQPTRHARSYVPLACSGALNNDPSTPGSYAGIPYLWWGLSITQETVSGAGTPTRTWSYGYSPTQEGWVDCFSVGCVGTVYTDVANPDGSTQRYTFSNKFDYTESQLVRTDYYTGAVGSTLLRSEISGYAPPNTSPLPIAGTNLQGAIVNPDQNTKYSPLNKRQILQDGDTYSWLAEAFNSYAQVTRAKRYSSIAGQGAVEEQTDYLNDPTLWVLGLPTQVTNLTTGEVVDKNVYNTTNDTLAERWHFGQKLMSYSFNAQGQLASFTDGNGHTTTLGSYKRGIPQAIGYPDGRSQSLVVDDFGQIASITDQAGATTAYSYDGVGRLTRITYPSGDEQAWYPKTFSYDFVTGAERGVGANHWRRTIAKGDQRQVTYFNAELQPVLTDTYINGDAASHSNVRSDYDFRGLTTFSSYPVAGSPDLSAITAGATHTYDVLGRLTRTQQTSELGTLTTTTSYLSGARKQVTDPKGKVTTTSYQVFDQPAYEAVIQVQAPAGVTQTIARDLYGNPTAIHQYGSFNGLSGDVTKTLVYDSYHRLCRTTEPESGSEVMAYDGANNLAWSAAGLSLTGTGCGLEQVADAGKTVRSYDAMNRLLTLTPPSGTQSTTYGYDALGNLKSAVSGISTWSATRNKLGQLTGETLQLTGQNAWTVGYAHDAYGSLASLTYPDGTAVAYAPDALGRATRVGAFASGIDYFPNGEVASFSYGNGATYLAEQNARQLLSNFSYGLGSTLNLSEDFAYDANGNITGVTDLVDGHRTKSFGYDDLNRLTSATASNLWGTESYSYDPLNNIKSRIGNGATFTYNYDALNRLASITGAGSSSFGYDNRGNVTSKNGSTLQFDQKNQLTQIDGLASYSYDAAGRRVMKSPASGGPTYYFYTQAGQLLYQIDTGAYAATDFIYLGRKLIAKNVRDTRILLPSEVNVTLRLVAGPTLSADAQAIEATVEITNQGTVTLTSSGSYPVHLGDHLVDASGKIVTNDLTRAAIPDIPPGGSAAVAIAVPANAVLGTGLRVQYLPVQEGVAWFDRFGTIPVTTGAFATPTAPATSTSGSYAVSWTGISGATSYTLQEQLNGGAWSTVQTSASLSWAASGKGNGTYGHRVQACNGGGCGPWSVTSTTVVTLPPTSAPTVSVPASSNTGGYTVSWTAVATATSYTLQEQINGGAWTTIQTGSATSRAVSGKGNGTYGYRAQGCNSIGCGPWSATSVTVVTYPPASAPTISAPASSTGSYTVSWTTVSTATSYTLQEQVNGGTWATIQAGSATSRALSGKTDATYGYRVQACNVGGCGPWSATVATVVALPPTSAPTVSVPASSNTGSYTVSWTAVSTATSYTLQEQVNGGAWATIQTGGATSRAISGKGNGTYGYRAQACNAGGCGSWSTNGTVVVNLPPATAPSVSAPSSSTTGSYTVSWTAVSTATSYTLQEQINGGAWATIHTGSATSRAISGKGNGTYGYHVQACNVGGCSGWSTTGSVNVLHIPPTPTGLSATIYETYDPDIRPPYSYELDASWSASSGAAATTFSTA